MVDITEQLKSGPDISEALEKLVRDLFSCVLLPMKRASLRSLTVHWKDARHYLYLPPARRSVSLLSKIKSMSSIVM